MKRGREEEPDVVEGAQMGGGFVVARLVYIERLSLIGQILRSVTIPRPLCFRLIPSNLPRRSV